MSIPAWLDPKQATPNLRTLSVPALERFWTANRNNLGGALAAEELMRRYSLNEVSVTQEKP